VRVLRSIVEPSSHLATTLNTKILHSCGVGFQAIGNDSRWTTMPLQHLVENSQCHSFVPFPGDVVLQNLAFVINGTPQVVCLAIDLDLHLIEMPAH
jgi:hypothetical protein